MASPSTPLSRGSSSGGGSSAGSGTPKTRDWTSPKLVSSTVQVKRTANKLRQQSFSDPSDKQKELGKCLNALITRQEEELFDLFLEEGADANGGGQQMTPLYVATDLGLEKYVKKLVDHGASLTRRNQDSEGDFPLALALRRGDSPIHRIFVNRIVELELAQASFPQPLFDGSAAGGAAAGAADADPADVDSPFTAPPPRKRRKH